MRTYPEGSGVVAVIVRSARSRRRSYCETDLSLPPTVGAFVDFLIEEILPE
jgi:hypothetical protein